MSINPIGSQRRPFATDDSPRLVRASAVPDTGGVKPIPNPRFDDRKRRLVAAAEDIIGEAVPVTGGIRPTTGGIKPIPSPTKPNPAQDLVATAIPIPGSAQPLPVKPVVPQPVPTKLNEKEVSAQADPDPRGERPKPGSTFSRIA